MDLPEAKYYGVQCVQCEKVFYSTQSKIELILDMSFQDFKKRLIPVTPKDIERRDNLPDFLETPLGLIVGFGRFPHVCI